MNSVRSLSAVPPAFQFQGPANNEAKVKFLQIRKGPIRQKHEKR